MSKRKGSRQQQVTRRFVVRTVQRARDDIISALLHLAPTPDGYPAEAIEER